MNCLCRPSRTISVRIVLLDETDFLHEIKDDLSGQVLLDVVFAKLNLIETAYFGLRYLDAENQTHWLDVSTRLSRQLKGSKDNYDMYFGVKFYAADPTKLVEEITRYQLFLQVKQDVLQGRLPVSFELAAEIGAFIVQSELGDYDSRRHSNGYVSEFRLIANQSKELENRVMELHQQLKGMSPSAAELNYLEKVKWNDMYGVDLHPVLVKGKAHFWSHTEILCKLELPESRREPFTPAKRVSDILAVGTKGEDSVEYFLGLTPSGIVVLRNKTTVAYYYWPRIAKVYFKGRYFMLRVCDKNNEVSTYGFETPRKSACRHLWRCCVEHHAFFRLVRVSPMQSQEGPAELFALGSRFRYSGRTEKQAVRDALEHGRAPPNFKRTPSRRQPRRVFDELIESKILDNNKHNVRAEIKSVSIPQPAQVFDSPYRSTCIVPTTLSIRHQSAYSNNTNRAPDSPRSIKSAPWARSQQKGLFGVTASPRSVRSATTRKNGTNIPPHRFRSSSVESQSSNDSRSCKKHRHRGRRTSDNESELSRGSGRSHNSHRKHRRQRSKHRRNDSGSDNDSSRARSFSGHRKSSGSVELVDSNHQWHEVQRRQAELTGGSAVQQASVMKSSMATKHQNNDTDSHSHSSSHHRSRRHKKNRSPSDSRSRVWSSELAKHLQFDLVDTAGMTEDQLREIPYTVVETHSSKRSNTNSVKVHKNTTTKDRVDRIRMYMPETNGNEPTINGSIRSASTISSNCDRNSSLVRMMSSLSMGDFISPSSSCLNPLDESGLRVSHEHTDSGLGADQDYAYSSERSSDSTKYGTNKSSGTSVTSGHHHKIIPPTLTHDSVSNRKKPPMHPNHQQNLRNSIVPVHSSNNRLYNNTVFHNNQYTFSLNRNGDGCYMETRPLSSASTYGDGGRVSRGTKSDIGVPCRRQSSTKSFLNSSIAHKSKIPSVKSDFLLSYLSNNQTHCTNSPAYHITGVPASVYSENYKTGNKCLYTNSSGKLELSGPPNTNYNEKQRNRVNTSNFITPTNASIGPLLYLDSDHMNNRAQSNTQSFQLMQSNPSSQVMPEVLLSEKFQTNKSSTAKSINRSASLELILTPIIQSSRRAQ